MIHQFSKEGNSLGISYSLYRNRQDNDAYKTFSTTFYQLQDISGRDSTDLQHQYQDSPGQSGNHEIRADYTWRITKKNNLQFSYAWGLQNEKEMQSTYDLSGNVPF